MPGVDSRAHARDGSRRERGGDSIRRGDPISTSFPPICFLHGEYFFPLPPGEERVPPVPRDLLNTLIGRTEENFIAFKGIPALCAFLACGLTSRGEIGENAFLRAGGGVAQLGEHHVRNVGVEGSIPFSSTTFLLDAPSTWLGASSSLVPLRLSRNLARTGARDCRQTILFDVGSGILPKGHVVSYGYCLRCLHERRTYNRHGHRNNQTGV